MSDIAKELRERSLRAEQEGEPLSLLDDAADEIERLRLTDEERAAIELAADVIAECEDDDGEPLDGVALTLRGILDRLK